MALITNLLSYWKCDENTGAIAADSVNSNNASLAGTTPLWAPGIIGSAIAANGTDNQATVTNPTNLGGLGAVSIQFWFKSNRTVGVFQKPFFLNGVWDIGVNNDGKIFWSNTIDNPGIVSNTVYSDGNPHHLIITYDGTTDLTYIDNVVVNTTVSVGGSLAATSGNNLYFAARNGGNGCLDGLMKLVTGVEP